APLQGAPVQLAVVAFDLICFFLPCKRTIMATATVSEKGQVVIPAEIRRTLGIAPGTQLGFTGEGQSLRVEVVRRAAPTRLEDGYGLLVCREPGKRDLAEFDVAKAMRERLE